MASYGSTSDGPMPIPQVRAAFISHLTCLALPLNMPPTVPSDVSPLSLPVLCLACVVPPTEPLTLFVSPCLVSIAVPGALPLVGNGSLPHVPFVLAEGDYDAPPEKLWDAMRAKKYVLKEQTLYTSCILRN
jgi:hypothetical protein